MYEQWERRRYREACQAGVGGHVQVEEYYDHCPFLTK